MSRSVVSESVVSPAGSASRGPVAPFAARVAGIGSSAIRDLLALTARPDIVSLAGGLPAPELLPTERLRAAFDAALSDPSGAQYAETTGVRALREVVARRETVRLGRPVASGSVVVTHGSQQALSLLASALLDPGDLVVVEEPAYTGALQVFRTAQARIRSVPLDGDGMDVGALESLLAEGERPRLVHTVATFHNPGGVVLSDARRVRLAALAERYGFRVVEDDPYGELYFGERPPAPIASHSDRVVRLSSASKVIAPALRVGWMVAAPDVCAAVEIVKQGADLCGSSLTQNVAADVLADDAWLAPHLDRVRATYADRAHALDDALRATFGARVDATRPSGGMFVWVRLPGVDTSALLERALARGVAYVPGAAFTVADPGRVGAGVGAPNGDAMRVCFATSSPDVLRGAVARLAAALASA